MVMEETTVIMGDWDSGGNTLKGQVSTKGKGFRYNMSKL